MKKHISFPEIGQFRNICSHINHQASFVGMDESNQPIYNGLLPKPTLTFEGTCKMHGTNAGVSYNLKDDLWVQSKEHIITSQKDNAGFAFFVETNRAVFIDLIAQVCLKENLDIEEFTLTIFGEWAGKGIQKTVAIAQVEKSFFIIGAKISKPEDESFKSYWIDIPYLKAPEHKIYNLKDFKTFSIDIDFNMPQLIQNKLIEWTIEVENECPVAKALGFEGTGEGIVFTTFYKGSWVRFKSKGEKHSISKVKVLNAVDTEKLNSIAEFIEYAVTENRFNQAIEKIFVNELPSMKGIADVMRWVVADIIKEESDVLAANALEPKDIGKYVSNKVRPMFFEFLNQQEMNLLNSPITN